MASKNQSFLKKLTAPNDIQLLFQSTRRTVSGARLYFRETNFNALRVIIAPGRGYGNAVQRNYIKRVGRNILQKHLHWFKANCDLALIFYSGTYSYQDRVEQVRRLLLQSPRISTLRKT